MSYAAAIAKAYPKSAPIAEAIVRVAKAVGAHPYDLANLIRFESGGSFSPSKKNPRSGAVGLIQFYPGLTKSFLGISVDELSKMTALQQMDYVELYLNKKRGKRLLDTPQKLYMAVFYPAAMSWPLTKQFPASVTSDNDNIYTVADYIRFVDKYAALPASTTPAAWAAEEAEPEAPVASVMPDMPSLPTSWMPSFSWPWSTTTSWRNGTDVLAYLVKDGTSFREGSLEPGSYFVRVHDGGTWKTLPAPAVVDSGTSYVLTRNGGRWGWEAE